MGKFNGYLLACDIDGTLMDNGYMNPRNIEKIEYFMSEGGMFSLSTGRSIGAISEVLAKLKRVSPSVVANGCMIYDYENGKTIYEEVLDKNDYKIANLLLNSGIDLGIEIHSRENVLNLRKNRTSVLHETYEKFVSLSVNFEEACNYSWNKVLYAFENKSDLNKAKTLIEKQEYSCNFIETTAVIEGEVQNYYEQIPKNVTKATALEKLCKIFDIKPNKLLAIGDFYNDLAMIEKAYIGATTIDAPDDIKQKSDFITGTCKDGAVADFIEYLSNIMR